MNFVCFELIWKVLGFECGNFVIIYYYKFCPMDGLGFCGHLWEVDEYDFVSL